MGNTSSQLDIPDIILIGDSVLDNFYWLEDHKSDVEHQLKQAFGEKIRIHNYALDETEISDILEGTTPNEVYIDARKRNGLEPYQLNPKDGKVYPLKLLSAAVKANKIRTKVKDTSIKPTVILSVGLSDIRSQLHYIRPLLITEAMKNNKFEENYAEIVRIITEELDLNLICVMCFEPHSSFTTEKLQFSRDDLLHVMDWGATRLMKICERARIPVLDLSRTFDPFDRLDYGRTDIEPSNKSGQYIVDLIAHILSNFDFIAYQTMKKDKKNQKNIECKSVIYYGKPDSKSGIQKEENTKDNRDRYFGVLQSRAPEMATDMDLLADLFSENDETKDDK